MRWLETKHEHRWLNGFRFAFLPRKVYTDIKRKNTTWIWLELYAVAEHWNERWLGPECYVAELFRVKKGAKDEA